MRFFFIIIRIIGVYYVICYGKLYDVIGFFVFILIYVEVIWFMVLYIVKGII